MSAGILSVMVAAGYSLSFIGLAGFIFTVPTFIEMNGDIVSLHPMLQKAVLRGMIFSLPLAGIGVCMVAYGNNDQVRYLACMEEMKDRDYCDSRHFVVRTHNEGKTQNAVTVNGL